MVRENLFTNAQHGFIPRRNCSTQFLEAVESWSHIIEKKGCIDVIYTDFSKAFDSVPHKRLLKKIDPDGIKGNVLNWIMSFLTNRKQRVNVEGKVSDCAKVKSGVPQGSVLGPILFVIYINEMPNVVINACKLFADDANIFADVSKPDTKLQEDIDNHCLWSDAWQLPFNETKCKYLHIGRNNPGLPYAMNGHIMESMSFQYDLGVIIDQDLKFH